MTGQIHGCNYTRRGLGFPLGIFGSLTLARIALLFFIREVVSPVSGLPVGAQLVMWCFAVTQLPLVVAFPPLSCSLLAFANSPVTKGVLETG